MTMAIDQACAMGTSTSEERENAKTEANINDSASDRGGWIQLKKSWTLENGFLKDGVSFSRLPPVWQMFLLGDGSPSRHVEILTRAPVSVNLITMERLERVDKDAPECVKEVQGPYVRRQVWLLTSKGEKYGYATSWWNADEVDSYLKDRNVPIWTSLSTNKTEIYRDIRAIYLGHSKQLEEAFGCEGPFWGRHYLFWHNGRPLTLIYEVFSPMLNRFFLA